MAEIDPLEQQIQTDVWFQRRLTELRSAPDLPASGRFDLAASPLSDDELEEAAGQFGSEYGRHGWGFSEIFRDLLSREPQRFEVTEIKTLQENLKRQGYVDPTIPTTGDWDPLWNAAFRRADRDAHDRFRAGKHWLSTPTEDALRFMTNTIPSKVFQGLVGSAKGLVKQSGETQERGGLLGGALGGAAVGAVVGGPVGAAIGGATGAAVGFFTDLFASDEGEEDQTVSEKLVDALSPWEEYRAQGSKALFEDLGFIASAASLVSGGAMAVRGLTAGAQGIRASVTGGTGLRQALLMKGVPQGPGLAAKFAGWGIKKMGAPGAAKTWIEFARAQGLIAQTSRPLIQTAIKGYTGLSAGQLGARYAAGFGSGEDAVTIEKEIENAPELPAYVDWTVGSIIYPERFLPISLSGAGRSIQQHLGETALFPFLHAAQKRGPDGRVPSLRQARTSVLNALGSSDPERAVAAGYLRTDYGVKRKAAERLAEKGMSGDEPNIERLWQAARSNVIREAKASEDFAAELVNYSFQSPTAFASYLESLEGKGSGLERMQDFLFASKRAQELTRLARDNQLNIKVQGGGFRGQPLSFDELAARNEVRVARSEAERIGREADKVSDPNKALELRGVADKLKADADELQTAIDSTKRLGTGEKQPLTLIPVRKYEPEAGIPGYATQQDIKLSADEYRRSRDDLERAADTAADNPDMPFEEMVTDHKRLVQQLGFRGLLTESQVAKGIQIRTVKAGKGKQRMDAVERALRKRIQYHAKDIDVDPGIAREFDERGYKLVASREDVLFFDDIPAKMEVAGVGDYTKRAAFFETVGLGMAKLKDRDIFRLREAHEQAEVGHALYKWGVPITGKQAMDRLHDGLNKMNHPALYKTDKDVITVGPGIITREGERTKVRMYRVDVRQLSPDDITEALKLDDFVDVADPYDVAKDVYGALKVGAAMGADAHLKRPLDAARLLGKAMRVNGLPGFSDFMRTAHLPLDPKTGTVFGAAAGAAIGGAVGGVEGAVYGGVGGALGGKRAAKGTYAWLPDKLHNANMALRYSLSFTYDLSRIVEQNVMGLAKAELPMMAAPRKYIIKHYGERGWEDAVNNWDRINGGSTMRVVDDIDRRQTARGMVGFSPRYHEAAQAYILKNRGMGDDEILETVSELGRYGLGRTGAEKTVNFVFFPFSFQKKFLATLGDFMLQAPARNLLINEGLRRYHQLSLDEKFADFIDKHLPFAEELQKLNNLALGVGPGRFFLEGLTDNRSAEGKVAQALTSLFVPSGAATPVAQSAGGLADAAVNFFTPIVVVGEDIDGLDDVLSRYIPLVRDIESYWNSAGEQVTAITEGGAPYYQLQEYTEEKRSLKSQYEGIALALGYESVDGLLQSEFGGALRAEVDASEMELAEQYPTGFQMSQEFTNSLAINEKALLDLAEKRDRSEAEENILRIAQMEQSAIMFAKLISNGTISQEDAKSMFAAKQMRKEALKHVEDRRFAELWTRFFEPTYGPIRKISA